MNYDMVLKNGYIVDPKNDKFGYYDIGINDGVVTAVDEEISTGDNMIDIKGDCVLPGVIDMHMHVTTLLGATGPLGYKMIAASGVTTAIDFAGPIQQIIDHLSSRGCGLNIGGLQAILPNVAGSQIKTNNPSHTELTDELDLSLANGSLGLKVLGGHYPLTPEATENAMQIANDNKTMIAFHAGSTASKSDMTGMREAIELARNKRIVLAHINSYCRGSITHPLDELKEALQLLVENDNVFPESYMSTINGASGYCENNVPRSDVSKMSLQRLGYSPSKQGLEEAISQGMVFVHKEQFGVNQLVTYDEGVKYWKEQGTIAGISFPINIPTITVGCAVERVKPGGDFIIDIQSTDGGGIPRNILLKSMHSLVQMGYLSLSEMVQKISTRPAQMLGLPNKGHIGIGADADITILNQQRSEASMSFVGGNLIMKDGVVFGESGQLICTEAGVENAKKQGLKYQVAHIEESTMYQ